MRGISAAKTSFACVQRFPPSAPRRSCAPECVRKPRGESLLTRSLHPLAPVPRTLSNAPDAFLRSPSIVCSSTNFSQKIIALRCPLRRELLARAEVRIAIEIPFRVAGDPGHAARLGTLRGVGVLPQPVILPALLHRRRVGSVLREPQPVRAEERIDLAAELLLDESSAVQDRLSPELFVQEREELARLIDRHLVAGSLVA